MTISDLGSIGEFISSIAVVVTLIYLSFQLRQNTRAAFFLTMDSGFWSHRNRLMPDELWERERQVIRDWVNTPGGRIAWQGKRSQVTRPFREYVESELLDDAG
jgi:hypothetical protein